MPPNPNAEQALQHLAGLSSWQTTGSVTGAIASATKAAVTDASHYVTGVSGSFNEASVGRALTLEDDGVVIARWYVHKQFHAALPVAIKITSGKAVALKLASGGITAVGSATLTGYTVPD